MAGNEKETALMKMENTAMANIDNELLEEANTQLSKILVGQILQQRLLKFALMATDEGDWDDMGGQRGKPFSGTPRLNACGAKKVRRIAQLQVETFGSVMVEHETDASGQLTYFAYECKGRVTSGWAPPMDCVGRCDSMNQFHSTRWKWNPDVRKKEKTRLPASEVNRVNIAQQAQTLCVTRGITQYLNMEKLTWEKVLAHTKMDPNVGARTVATFGQPENKPNNPPPPENTSPQDPPPPEGVAPALVTAIKKFGLDAGVVRDAVSWWSLVTETVGAEYALNENQTEEQAYAKWTSEIAAKVKDAIAKQSEQQ